MIVHPIPPLFDANSKTLILGSFPSVKSREAAFFYGHPQNRFWPVIAAVLGEEKPQNIEEKKGLFSKTELLCEMSLPPAKSRAAQTARLKMLPQMTFRLSSITAGLTESLLTEKPLKSII